MKAHRGFSSFTVPKVSRISFMRGLFSGTMDQNNQESRPKYWVSHSSVCLFASTAHSFACQTLLLCSHALLLSCVCGFYPWCECSHMFMVFVHNVNASISYNFNPWWFILPFLSSPPPLFCLGKEWIYQFSSPCSISATYVQGLNKSLDFNPWFILLLFVFHFSMYFSFFFPFSSFLVVRKSKLKAARRPFLSLSLSLSLIFLTTGVMVVGLMS